MNRPITEQSITKTLLEGFNFLREEEDGAVEKAGKKLEFAREGLQELAKTIPSDKLTTLFGKAIALEASIHLAETVDTVKSLAEGRISDAADRIERDLDQIDGKIFSERKGDLFSPKNIQELEKLHIALVNYRAESDALLDKEHPKAQNLLDRIAGLQKFVTTLAYLAPLMKQVPAQPKDLQKKGVKTLLEMKRNILNEFQAMKVSLDSKVAETMLNKKQAELLRPIEEGLKIRRDKLAAFEDSVDSAKDLSALDRLTSGLEFQEVVIAKRNFIDDPTNDENERKVVAYQLGRLLAASYATGHVAEIGEKIPGQEISEFNLGIKDALKAIASKNGTQKELILTRVSEALDTPGMKNLRGELLEIIR